MAPLLCLGMRCFQVLVPHVKVCHGVGRVSAHDAVHHRVGVAHTIQRPVVVRASILLALVAEQLPLHRLKTIHYLLGRVECNQAGGTVLHPEN